MRFISTTFAVLMAPLLAHAGAPELRPPTTGARAPDDAAVVIGVERYDALPEVAYAERDAETFAALLRDTVGVPRSRVKVLLGKRATGVAMRREVAAAAKKVGPKGRLWVYFSGHGAPAKDDAWLMGYTVLPEPDYLAEGALSRRELVRLAGGIPSGARAVVVLDACFSGKDRAGGAMSKLRFTVATTLATTPQVAVWSATQADEYAGPLPSAEHGLFTYFVVGALSGWADANGDGRVAFREAERYVAGAMSRVLERAGRSQRPKLTAADEMDRWQLLALGRKALTAPAVDHTWLAAASSSGTVSGGVVRPGVKLDEGEDIVNAIVDETGFLVVETDPPGASLKVNGKKVGNAPWQDEQMVGRYVVVAEHGALYHPARQELALGLEGATVSLTLKPAFGTLTVESEPAGAAVWLDGEQVGETPWTDARRRSGRYGVRVTRALHLDHEETVEVRDGQTSRVRAKLPVNFGRLRVESTPPGASIALDGRDTGQVTPHVFEALQAGAHTVELTMAGHGRAATRVTIEREDEATARLELAAKLGLLTVMATDADGKPCRGAVEVDGVEKGTSPLKVKVVEGTRRVRVTCGRASGEEEVAVVHNGKASVTVEMGGGGSIQWVRVKGGSFRMGSTRGDKDEKPVRRVRVPTFELAKTEVTVGQYRACVEAGACTAPDTGTYCNWGKADRDDHPINCVDWSQASAFSKWVGGRLPTEAEWEYAARSGGREQAYPWGDEAATCARAVTADGGDGCGKDRTWPVCSKPSGNSRQGVCDLAGNVWEWVEDWYGPYGEAPTDGSARTRAAELRVHRGGSWGSTAAHPRAARRAGSSPGNRFNLLGFRPAR